jgi:hypothetical protein
MQAGLQDKDQLKNCIKNIQTASMDKRKTKKNKNTKQTN